MTVGEATEVYAAYLNGCRAHPEDEELAEDLKRARAAMERAWLEAKPVKEAAVKKYTVYQDTGQWVPLFNWFWSAQGEAQNDTHGPYPARWMASLAGWLNTR